MNRIFVYGTLKRGDLIRGMHLFDPTKTEYIGKAVTTDSMFNMVDLGSFPGVILNGEYNVTGEVYDVDDETLESLDAIEGYPEFYNKVPTETSQGKAMMYFLPKEYAKYPGPEQSQQIDDEADTLTWIDG